MPFVNINFFDDTSDDKPVLREDVRIRELKLELSPEKRRVAVEFDLTPFIERPSLEVYVANGRGEKAGSITVIETLDHKFSLVIHLRDREPTEEYELQAAVYYAALEQGGPRQFVHTKTISFSVND